MAQIEDSKLKGPLFGPDDDLLAIAEEIIDRRNGEGCNVNASGMDTPINALVDRLIMIDIARSLRTIAQRQQVTCRHNASSECKYRRSYGGGSF
jgi:hypothetical protein